MKKSLLNIAFAVMIGGLVILTSCAKDEPLPLATVGFEVITNGPEVSVPVRFQNSSFNADFYVWDYGDGTKDSSATIINGSHIYDDPGNYTVTLRAYNQDAAFSETTKSITVGERFMLSLGVLTLGLEDINGNSVVVDSVRGIDLMFSFGPVEGEVQDFSLVIDSVGAKRGLPNGLVLNNDYVLTDEDYLILLYRLDSLVDDTYYRTLLDGVQFNPLDEDLSFKDENGSGGIIISPPYAAYGYQYVIEFEID